MRQGGLYTYVLALRKLLANIGASIGRPDLPKQIPRTRKPSARKTIATPEEIAALCAAAPTWLRTIVLLAAHGGFRRGDCMRIAPLNYDAEKRIIAIEQEKTKQAVVVPVTDELARTLEAAPTHSPSTPFYELHRGRPISAEGLNTAWHRLKAKAKVNPDLWIHDLRRTVAVSLYEVSKDLRVVEQMLGHQSLSSTIRYIEHRDPAKLRPYLDSIYIPKGRLIQ